MRFLPEGKMCPRKNHSSSLPPKQRVRTITLIEGYLLSDQIFLILRPSTSSKASNRHTPLRRAPAIEDIGRSSCQKIGLTKETPLFSIMDLSATVVVSWANIRAKEANFPISRSIQSFCTFLMIPVDNHNPFVYSCSRTI